MGSRGRQSSAAASLSVVVNGDFGKSLAAPKDLTPPQAAIWAETVASEAPSFFATAALRGLLKDYCRHREAAEMLSGMIDGLGVDDLKTAEGAKRYYSLLRMRDLETRATSTVATKLRITNQARYTAQAAGTAARHAAKVKKPWE
jgi:hypothetical protein